MGLIKGVLLGLFAGLLLSGCAGVHNDGVSAWPEELPPGSFFVAAYERDAELHELQSQREYLAWVRSFYTGTAFYSRGWNELSAEILDATEDRERALSRERRLSLLGRDIAAEWAKDNSVRRVDSRHLAVWGAAAARAVKEDNVDETLQKISMDLHKLLALDLEPSSITADRYHLQDPDDWFAF